MVFFTEKRKGQLKEQAMRPMKTIWSAALGVLLASSMAEAKIVGHAGTTVPGIPFGNGPSSYIHILVDPASIGPHGLTPAQIQGIVDGMSQSIRNRARNNLTRPLLTPRLIQQLDFPGFPGVGGQFRTIGGHTVYVFQGRQFTPIVSQFGQVFFIETTPTNVVKKLLK